MITVTEALPAQLPLVRKMAYRIWPSAFAGILDEAQVAYMLQWMYSLEALAAQWAAGHRFLLAFEGRRCCGYAAYALDGMATLHKLYVLASCRGKGAGTTLLDAVASRGRAAGLGSLRLHVNRYNPAVHYYHRRGFRIVAEEDNPIGQGYFMNDYVMERPL